MRISDWSSDVCSSDLSVARDIDPEIFALTQALIHFIERMDDDVDRPTYIVIVQDLVLGDIPIVRDVRQVGMADDDQQIEIGLIAIFGFIDPIRARIAPKEEDRKSTRLNSSH